MITQTSKVHPNSPSPDWHAAFLAMLPAIRRRATYAFRCLQGEAREGAIEEVVCAACAAFARLASQGKAARANPSALARFAVRQFRSGRRLGCKLNVNDVSSPHCQLQRGIPLERLDQQNRETGQWTEILLESRKAGPAATAAARIDVHDWFETMRPRDCQMAQTLASGEQTRDVARKFGISSSRVSQKRSEFRQSWDEFHREADGHQQKATEAAAY